MQRRELLYRAVAAANRTGVLTSVSTQEEAKLEEHIPVVYNPDESEMQALIRAEQKRFKKLRRAEEEIT